MEEEFHVVDLVSRRLTPQAHVVLDGLPDPNFSAELQRAVVETNSTPTPDLAALRAEPGRPAAAAHRQRGTPTVSASSAPAPPRSTATAVSSSPPTNATNISSTPTSSSPASSSSAAASCHVEIGDRDLAVLVAQRVQPWLPVLLAISGSSPYWFEKDSGYASSRALAWQRWPTAGPLGPFESAAEYDKAVADLVTSGVIDDRGMVYFDIRLSRARADDGAAGVRLGAPGRRHGPAGRAVPGAGRPGDRRRGGRRAAPVRPAARDAARRGLAGGPLGVWAAISSRRSPANPGPAAALVEALLDELRPTLEALGDWETDLDAGPRGTVRLGGSAARQRMAYTKQGQAADVVDLLLRETGEG